MLRCLENTQFSRNESETCDKAIEDILSKIIHLEETKLSILMIEEVNQTTIIQRVVSLL